MVWLVSLYRFTMSPRIRGSTDALSRLLSLFESLKATPRSLVIGGNEQNP